jgi:hypothetical protein
MYVCMRVTCSVVTGRPLRMVKWDKNEMVVLLKHNVWCILINTCMYMYMCVFMCLIARVCVCACVCV